MNEFLIEATKKNRELINKKLMLREFYLDNYRDFSAEINLSDTKGSIVELGCGATFIKEIISDAIRTDVFKHSYCDIVVNATKMPFPDSSVKAFFMMNVFHHVPDINSFLKEVNRCLEKNGILYIADQHVGILSFFILKFFHNEYFDHRTKKYTFKSVNPLNSANGALAWIVFKRDKPLFEIYHPGLKIVKYNPCYPLMYWVLGGLKEWSLIKTERQYKLMKFFEKILLFISPNFGSFVKIIIKKK